MVLVIIPAYNEEKKVGRVIRGLFEQGYKDVVVVDDGSKDKTSEEAAKAGAKVFRHRINRGQGAALETGDEYARSISAETVVHFDADDQFDPKEISEAVKFLEKNNLDLVFGSRFLKSNPELPLFKKYFILPLGRLINYFFTGLMLSDAHNGFRILNNSALQKIHFRHDRMSHNTEILKLVKKNNLKYQEYPITVRYSNYGQGLGGGVKIVYDLIIGLFT